MNHLIIPNYNGNRNINEILADATLYNFDSVTVCDDCSTEPIPNEVVEKYPKVHFVFGKEKLGPGGNRSRILNDIGDGRRFELNDLLYFLDVDMKINDINIQLTENYFKTYPEVAIVGGLILTTKGEPMWWNYGYEMHPCRGAKEAIYLDVALAFWRTPEVINEIRKKALTETYNLEMSFGDQSTPRNVGWVSEANFVIRAADFLTLGGFDKDMFYHADQDLCKRARGLGRNIVFNPFIKTTHLEIDTFGPERESVRRENAFYFYKKHYNMSRETFDYLFSL